MQCAINESEKKILNSFFLFRVRQSMMFNLSDNPGFEVKTKQFNLVKEIVKITYSINDHPITRLFTYCTLIIDHNYLLRVVEGIIRE